MTGEPIEREAAELGRLVAFATRLLAEMCEEGA